MLEARRETAELRFEDMAMGSALTQLLANLGVAIPERRLPFASAFAIAAVELVDSRRRRLRRLRVGLVRGASRGSREARAARPHGRPTHAARARRGDSRRPSRTRPRCRDDEIGASLPGLAIASALHETQYTRLFRS